MKKTILIIATFIVALLPVFAQNISENKTLRKDRVWYFDAKNEGMASGSKYFYEVKVSYDRDSIIDGKNYMIFLIEDKDNYVQIPLFLREENRKIYRRFEAVDREFGETKDNIELLLYDFSEDGETKYVTGLDFTYLGECNMTVSGWIEVVNREIITVKGEQLVQLSAKSRMDEHSRPYEFKIVEGIGAVQQGLLGYLLQGLATSGGTFTTIGFNRLEDTEGNLIFNASDIGFAGVETVGADSSKADGRMFDLMGREIRNPQRGTLYIRDGRKHIAR